MLSWINELANKTITFYITKEELKQAFPRLIEDRLSFKISVLSELLIESYTISVPLVQKEKIARILYAGSNNAIK